MIRTPDILVTRQTPSVVSAIVRGATGGIHDVRFASSLGSWCCTCPDTDPECAHILATRQLVEMDDR